MSIRINAPVLEVRTAAGHDREQWDRFYFITKDEAKQLASAHEDWTKWGEIPLQERYRLLDRVNDRLQAEGIPKVEIIIVRWRFLQLLRDIQRKYTEGSMTRGMQGSSSGSPIQVQTRSPDSSTQQSSSPKHSEHSPSETRPYDPIRDV